MTQDDLRVRCNVTIAIVDAVTGQVRREHHGHNLVTNAGLAAIAAAFGSSTAGLVTHFGLGSSNTAAAAGDVALGSEVSKPLITYVSSSGAVATMQYYLSSSQLNGSTLREAGLWCNTTTLLARYIFSDADFAPKTNAVAGVFTWTLTIARA
jgi:hypothetical protein